MKRREKIFSRRLAVIGAAVVIIGAGGLVVAVGRADERLLASAADSLLSAPSLYNMTELTINLPQRLRNADRPFTTLLARVEGDVQRGEEGTVEMTGQVLLEARGRGNIFFADGEIEILKDSVLFNLDDLPVFLDPRGRLVNKWTRVETNLLSTSNPEQVKQALAGVFSQLTKVGKETVAGESLVRFTGSLTAEQEAELFEILRRRTSGNAALHQVARLLQANNVKTLDIWIDSGSKELRLIQVNFVRPLNDGREFDFAKLTMRFDEFGKVVAFKQPQSQLTVRPDVFGRILGSGEVEEINLETE